MKRIFLFLITNIAILITISVVLSVLGIGPYLTQQGLDYGALLAFCLVWGFVGSFMSLAMSRIMAKWMTGARTIRPNEGSQYQWLYNMVEQLSKAAGLPRTPEVAVYDSPETNAFATGPSKNRALVAFSTGILSSMSRDQIEAVAAHELTHVSNGDMVTMTLLQGVVNAFVMFFARVIAYAASQGVREENARTVQFLVTLALELVLGMLGMIVVFWFSRQREFRADYGSAKLTGPGKMISALQTLGARGRFLAQAGAQQPLSTFKIATPQSGWTRLWMSHPPIEERIAALERLA